MPNVTNNEEAVVRSRRSRWRRVMWPWIRTWLQQHLKIGLEPQAQHRKEGSYPGSQFLNLSFLGKGWVSCQTWRWFFSWTATLLRGFWSGLSSRETVCFPVQLHVQTSPRHVNKVFATWFPSKLKVGDVAGKAFLRVLGKFCRMFDTANWASSRDNQKLFPSAWLARYLFLTLSKLNLDKLHASWKSYRIRNTSETLGLPAAGCRILRTTL
jgi:hypothetical protein